MSRLHELVPSDGHVVVHNERYGHTLVLHHTGAVFVNESCEPMAMTPAFGVLLSDDWGYAYPGEIEAMRETAPDFMSEWIKPPGVTMRRVK